MTRTPRLAPLIGLALVAGPLGCDNRLPTPFKSSDDRAFDPTPPPAVAEDTDPQLDDTRPDDLGCADLFLGSAVGSPVHSGDTFGTGDDHAFCGEGDGDGDSIDTGWSWRSGAGDDILFYWVAPETEQYTIDTQGSSFDTMLTVYARDCGSRTLACNDDSIYGLQSQVSVRASRGDVFVIALDGYSEGETGSYNLNINPGAPDTGWWRDTGWIDEPTPGSAVTASLHADGAELLLKVEGGRGLVAAFAHAAHPSFGADSCGIIREDGVESACHPLPPPAGACGGARALRLLTDLSATPAARSTRFRAEDVDQLGVLLMSDPAIGGDGACYTLGAPIPAFEALGCAEL